MKDVFSRAYPRARYVILVHGGAGLVPEAARARHASGCLAAARAGARILEGGGSALDAVCAAVTVLEDDPSFNAGHGACLDETGHLSLDAAVMDGETLRVGALACLPPYANPVQIARKLMEAHGPVLLAGEGAAKFAKENGFSPMEESRMVTAVARERLAEAKARGVASGFAGGTVGAVACSLEGHVAAATSTGGKTNKALGRIGDSPLVGAGTYADDGEGAASGTGDGEAFIRLLLARRATMALKDEPDTAARRAIEALGGRTGALGGVILVSPRGEASFARNTPTMGYAVVGDGLEDSGC